jgi:D-alanyl-D-alanine carboxypeptidase/D-alanyl-D-alanine-endopeptidase (penicillin-binding protein 4)
LPVRKPALYAADVFSTLARSQGIVLKPAEISRTLPEGQVMATLRSGPLRKILQDMLKYSTNITAEMVGMSASLQRLGHVRSIRASADEMSLWARDVLGMDNPAFVDHSGLGDQSRISPYDMVQALVTAHRDKRLRPILKPVRLRDAKGRPTKTHPLKVDAKTGTLNFVSCLAGYITTPKGRVLAFATFTSNEAVRSTLSRAERERPPGGRTWARRSRSLQQDLLERWGQVYAT